MPKPADYLKLLGFNLPQEDSVPQVTPEAQDAWAAKQPPLKPWQQKADAGVKGLVDAFRGVTGLGEQGPAGPTMTNAGQILGAALPIFSGVKGVPGMYSRLTRAMEERMPALAHPSKVESIIKNFATREESDMRGLSDLLKGPVTAPGSWKDLESRPTHVRKEDVLAHLERNPVELKVKELKNTPGWTQERSSRLDELERNHNRTEAQDVEFQHLINSENEADISHPPKYENYQVPGGENYKETLISKPPKPFEMGNDADYQDWYHKKYGAYPGTHIDESDVNTYRSYMQDRGGPPDFMSSHWDEPNVLAHVRSNDRYLAPKNPNLQIPEEEYRNFFTDEPGHQTLGDLEQHYGVDRPKGRHIEEVQSDLHQRGKAEGYAPSPQEKAQMEQELKDLTYQNAADIDKWTSQLVDQGLPDPSMRIFHQALEQHAQQQPEYVARVARARQIEARLEKFDRGGVPDAPFKETWPDLALKQQLLDVAQDPELSWIGFTTGDTQSKRYNFQNQVNRLDYDFDPNTNQWDLSSDTGGPVGFVDDKDLHRWIGADAADALRADRDRLTAGPQQGQRQGPLDSIDGGQFEEDIDPMSWEPNPDADQSGLGGFVSGTVPTNTILNTKQAHGMNTFYDKKLPSALGRILKPFGGKVELGEIPGPPDSWSVKVPTTLGLRPAPGGYSGNVLRNNEPIASTWPPEPIGPGAVVSARGDAADLSNLISKQPTHQPKGIPTWIAHLSPEMKAAIMKSGLPLLSLMGLFAPDQSQQSQDPLQGLKEAN